MNWINLAKGFLSAIGVLIAISYGVRRGFQRYASGRDQAFPLMAGLCAAAAIAGIVSASVTFGPVPQLVHIAYFPLVALALLRQPGLSVVAAGLLIGAGQSMVGLRPWDVHLIVLEWFALILYARVVSYIGKSDPRFPVLTYTTAFHIAWFIPALYVWPAEAGGSGTFMLAQTVSWIGCSAGAALIRSMQKEQVRSRLLAEEASRDHLTRLYNLRFFQIAFERYADTAAELGKSLSLAFIDIDYFKTVNDKHGHLAGDRVLQELAARIVQQLRSVDIAARYGGEEFVVLFPGCSPEQAAQAAERIRQRVEREPVQVGGEAIPMTVSIGVSSFPDCPKEMLIAAADAALYRAKRQGRNCVVAASGRCPE